jgi:hypothetical protein
MIWAIGDIHGMLDPLKRVLSEIRLLEESDDPVEKIIFIGDYIDHGPSSKEVIDFVRRLDYETVLLMGNHEDMALRFIKRDMSFLEALGNSWLGNGAADTYLSICGDPKNIEKARKIEEVSRRGGYSAAEFRDYQGVELPKVYESFLTSLKYSHAESFEVFEKRARVNFFHALPDDNRPLSEQRAVTRRQFDKELVAMTVKACPELSPKKDRQELLHESRRLIERSNIWGRSYNFESGYDGEAIVHGHTPTLYYPQYYGTMEREAPDYCAQFQRYPANDLIPFIFSRSPGAFCKKLDKGRFEGALKRLRASSKWRLWQMDCYAYRTEGEKGIEAINIDTGAVAGGGLTALGLSSKFLREGFLMSLVYPNDGDQRRKQQKIIKRAIMIDKLGGEASKD